MGQVSATLRKLQGGFSHWCSGCEEMHAIHVEQPNGSGARWSFDGNVGAPTFSPSIHIRTNHRDMAGYQPDLPSETCHYFIRAGRLEFCSDSTHALAGQTVPLPPLPEWLRDGGA